MRTVVAVTPIADLPEDLQLARDRRSVEAYGLQWDLGEGDRCALEAALELRDAIGGEVIVMTAGDERARDGLLTALALGAERAVQVVPAVPAELDPVGAAQALAGLVEREAADLVLAGAPAAADPVNALGVALAAFLGLPRVTGVRQFDYDPGAQTVTVQRALERGRVELLAVPTPALLTIEAGSRVPRYARLSAIRRALAKPMQTVTAEPAEAGAEALAAGSGARLMSLTRPARTAGAEMIAGEPVQIAARIAEIVRDRVN